MDEQYDLYFTGFSPKELDSITIRWYNKGDGFSTPIATATYSFSPGIAAKDTLALSAAINSPSSNTGQFTSRYDVEIYVPSLPKTYRISDVKDQGNTTSVIKTCWNTKVRTDCVNGLQSFKLGNNTVSFGDDKAIYLSK